MKKTMRDWYAEQKHKRTSTVVGEVHVYVEQPYKGSPLEKAKQLEQAKKLLKKWVELYKPKVGNIPPTPIQVETEQFLSEVEK